MSPRFPIFASSSEARTATLQSLLIAAIVITGLYVAREVLLPLALAILLSFVLTPALLFLRRLKVPRVVGVAIVVAFAFALIFGLGWLMSQQATQLAGDLPRYQQVLAEKISALRKSAAGSPALEKAAEAVKGLERELSNPTPEPKVGVEPSPPEQMEEGRAPIPVEIREPPPRPLELFQRIAGTVLPPLATAGIVILFVIFILLQREDLRDRAIRLVGASDMQRATSAMNDAAERLSKYFLSQVLLNSAYGIFITLGLWLIGVPSPIVWGILAMLMRFVPYVGSFIAAAPPLLLAAVVEPGWTTFLLTGALYLVSELTMGQVVEPLVFGRGTGVSPIAVIISTVFWTWLYGPLGLLLAMPLTVCLVVLGRHVEGLNFFEVLLGDKPALTPQQSFYQRVLTGDSAEATYQAELALRMSRWRATWMTSPSRVCSSPSAILSGVPSMRRISTASKLPSKRSWMTLLISSRGAGSGRWSPLRRRRMGKKRRRDWLRLALWMRQTRSRFQFLSLPISRRAGKKMAQSCASVAERPSMRRPLPCLPGY
jgi:predicted PurR-regulated permease PerM